MLKRLTFLSVILVPQIQAKAELLDVEDLHSACNAWTERFGTRQVNVAHLNPYGDQIHSSVKLAAVPRSAGGCVTDSHSVVFSVQRVESKSNATFTYGINIGVPGAPWELQLQNTNCVQVTAPNVIESFRSKMIVLDEFETDIRRSIESSFCPNLSQSVKSLVLDALSK